jgi:hypothetical protein
MLAVRHGVKNHSNAALFVLPSELEGRSLALLDAMAAGVSVLTSDIPENNEVSTAPASPSTAVTRQILSACSTSSTIPNFAASPQPVNASGSGVSISGPKSPALSKKAYYTVFGRSANEHTPSEQIQIRSAAR